MRKNQNSAVLVWIWLELSWMIPMGVRDNHTKWEPKTRRWRPETAFAIGSGEMAAPENR